MSDTNPAGMPKECYAIPDPASLSAARDMIDWAWGIIANAGGGNWDNETPQWREAATKWRDEMHARRPSHESDSV